jgi:hypothetical protein
LSTPDLLSGSGTPVASIRYSQGSGRGDLSWDKHRLVTGQNCLAPRHRFTTVIDSYDRAGTLNTVRLVRKRLVDSATVITKQSSVLVQLAVK